MSLDSAATRSSSSLAVTLLSRIGCGISDERGGKETAEAGNVATVRRREHVQSAMLAVSVIQRAS